ncbi:MAG: riboflavin synthase [Candidatus Omnitrophica bacterium]|nr:riboflavin synthase [Candidatus Omnitrophota bacterium]
MFTGIVSEIGKVKSIRRRGALVQLEVECGKRLIKETAIGASIAINGVCLSVTRKNGSLFFDVVENTLKKTNLKRLKISSPVNLEKALKLGDDVSGHMVTGHVDDERRIKRIQRSSAKCILDVNISPNDEKYLVQRGSVAIDGVSLTVAEVYGTFFRVYLIPHTIENTVLKFKKQNDHVNVEYDMTAKYIEKGLGEVISKDFLRKKGFI